MKKAKPRRTTAARVSRSPVMVMPPQTHDEIWRRREIREAIHDARAKTLDGKK